ncbi:MAG: Glucose-6-phosphate 1-dehydrogenase [Candidatus Daviesbacteria bacterium GW2011_GWA2_38_24]|uniref:Glucose-6-phosphate 1-dehydrogenase n=1 Tax=Candidatus Daviesbacteria bacterium GW2011_GWA2_38_24 TaxID=1618422 RepID=A0A0G0JGJ5_9BACT|nr:MAG: Glucose-6-phosphate 1-dehydrogenase [Candidatus Daviesbacteria bacterium GW2011_GWA2_38_24]KKQ80357.1 MAG: Glucose-6-phosphate 1-dehydrogenase [Candidatus Daviesbacteria bacterium GW2011_GWA1_38_7]OGE24663.1 MAG: glucose-6-phosphate dehydrogenase [Candidatus Daviesbacteria bacterium RIFCSPHIGHO2_01_FULL_38_8]
MESLNFVIFGITSNLAQIKLIPALYDLAEANMLPANTNIIGISRHPKDFRELQDYFKEVLSQENRHHQHKIKPEVFEILTKNISHVAGHAEDAKLYRDLEDHLSKLNTNTEHANTIFYLATYPELYEKIFSNLKNFGLNKSDKGWVRVIIEKPIGNDLQSAKQLNNLLSEYFTEDQIYRLDHYLGKETLQNILTFRFANNIFEHLINKDHIDHIQVSALEDFGIGQRGGYYDSVGALKDVGQNHQLQMVAFATMDRPLHFTSEEITKKRIEILKSLVPMPNKVVFGQYKGYKEEKNINPNSQTDTYYALKSEIENERFKGVPIYVRAGKKLKETVTEISIVFKATKPNVLIYRIQPNEGIVLKILTKKPGHTLELEETYMQFCYHDYGNALPDAYERLISDAINGDQTFFNHAEEVEAQWAFIDPLASQKTQVHEYGPGTWGPEEADKLIKEDGRSWLKPSNLFCKF